MLVCYIVYENIDRTLHMGRSKKCTTGEDSKGTTKEVIDVYGMDEDTEDEELDAMLEEEFERLDVAIDLAKSHLGAITSPISPESSSKQTHTSTSKTHQQESSQTSSTPTTVTLTENSLPDVLWDLIRIVQIIRDLL